MRKKTATRGRRHPYAVDERLVMAETPFEILDGKVFHVPAVDPPHATLHARLCALLETHVAPGFIVACDMLTRTSPTSDFAPDAGIYPSERDPETGGRQLEAIAFEIVSKQGIGRATKKAKELVRRGVRRVFALDVKRERALEWSRSTRSWEILGADAVIDDPTLVVSIPVRALVDASRAGDAIARALLAKSVPLLTGELAAARHRGEAEGRQRGRREGRREGARQAKAEALVTVLTSRGLRVSRDDLERIRAASTARLDAWLSRAATCASVRELLAPTPKARAAARPPARRAPATKP